MTVRSFLRGGYASLVVALLSACGGGGGGDDDGDFSDIPVTTTDFVFVLSPEQVIAGAAAQGSVSATASLQTRARGNIEIFASGSVSLNGFDATSVDIHEGFAGETGPLALQLQQSNGTTWTLPANTELDEEELRRLEQAGFYVLASSAEGQLRGQILPDGWSVTTFDLSGQEVVPAVATSATSRGAISIRMTPGSRHAYHLRVTSSGLGDVLGGVMAEAFAGGNGDAVVTLEQSNASPDVWGTGDVNNIDFSPILLESGLETFMTGQFYVALATAANPDGEIRGQLVPDGVELLPVAFSADEVVPGPVASEGSASAVATYRPSTGTLAVNLSTDLPSPFGVSLHQAPSGQNGPLLFSLFQDSAVPGLWSLAATMLSADQQTALEEGALYLTVLTSDYPEGELRGQLAAAPPEATVALIGPAGGTLTTPDGVTLNVPPGALADTHSISVRRLGNTAALPAPLADPLVPLHAAVDLAPEGLQFAQPVTLSIGLKTAAPPGASQPVLLHHPDTGEWEETAFIATVDADGNTATVELMHFSDYVVTFSEVGSAGYFGPANLVESPQVLFDRVRNRFTELFLLQSALPLDPGTVPANDPNHPGLDLFNCYAPRAAHFVLDSKNSSVALSATTGNPEGATFQMQFSRHYDQTFSIGDSELEVVAQYLVNVFFFATSPDVEVTASPEAVWVTGQSDVSARVLCGETGFRDQNVTLTLSDETLGLIAPSEGTTDEDGAFAATLSTDAIAGGSGQVTAATDWSDPVGGVSLTFEDETDVEVFSLTGSWSGSGSETISGCEDPEDNGTFADSASFPILQSGFGISGGAFWTSFSGTVTPQPDGTFSMAGTYTDTEEGIASGQFNGTGSAASGVLDLSWSGSESGDTCVFAGSGTATRQ